jgi:hypothetical protein
VYFRHGAKSEPATTADLREFVDRRVEEVRQVWIGRIRLVVEAPEEARVGAPCRRGGTSDGDPPNRRSGCAGLRQTRSGPDASV